MDRVAPGADFLAVFLTDFTDAVLGAASRTATTAAAFFAAFAGADFAVLWDIAFAASARFSAHRFLVAATIAALPALLSRRLALGGQAADRNGGTLGP